MVIGLTEWFQVRIPKDTCLEEIGLFAQNMMTILDSSVNKIGRLNDHLMSTKYFISSDA